MAEFERRKAGGHATHTLLLLVYSLWNLFLRLREPARHVEAAGGWRRFLVIATRLVQRGRKEDPAGAGPGLVEAN